MAFRWRTTLSRSYVNTHRVIDTPHKNTKKRFVCTEQLNLLMFNSKMFLFELAKPTGHLWCTRHVSRAGASYWIFLINTPVYTLNEEFKTNSLHCCHCEMPDTATLNAEKSRKLDTIFAERFQVYPTAVD